MSVAAAHDGNVWENTLIGPRANISNIIDRSVDKTIYASPGYFVRSTEFNHRDPIYKINVNLTFDHVEYRALWVSHTATSGAVYVRSDQYTRANVWETPGRMEWCWRGTRGANVMIGEVWHDDQGWFYSEKLFHQGSYLEYEMVSQCNQTTIG